MKQNQQESLDQVNQDQMDYDEGSDTFSELSSVSSEYGGDFDEGI